MLKFWLRSPQQGRSVLRFAPRWLAGGLLAVASALAAPSAMAEVTVNTVWLPIAGTDQTAYAGDIRTLRITVSNSDTDPVMGGVLTSSQVLPADFSVESVVSSNSCGATVTTAAGRNIGFTGATVPAKVGTDNGSCYVDIEVRVNERPAASKSSTTTIGKKLFTGTVGGVQVTNANPAEVSLQVGLLGKLQASKSFSPATVRMGETSTITITVTNPTGRPRATTITAVGETLPDNLTASTTTTGGTCGAGTASGLAGAQTITLADGKELQPGQSCTITWLVIAGAMDSTSQDEYKRTNIVPANSVKNDREMQQDAATAEITVQSPVTLKKSFQYESIRPNQPVKMTITVQNRSANAATFREGLHNLRRCPTDVRQ